MAKRFIRGHLFSVDGVRYHRIAVYKLIDNRYQKVVDHIFSYPLSRMEKEVTLKDLNDFAWQ